MLVSKCASQYQGRSLLRHYKREISRAVDSINTHYQTTKDATLIYCHTQPPTRLKCVLTENSIQKAQRQCKYDLEELYAEEMLTLPSLKIPHKWKNAIEDFLIYAFTKAPETEIMRTNCDSYINSVSTER